MSFFWISRGRRRGHCAPRTRFRPRMDLLEDRVVLSQFTVTSALDSGAGTLRDAISLANLDSDPHGSLITFKPNVTTINLTSDPLTINPTTAGHGLDIEGEGRVKIDAAGNTGTGQIFVINASSGAVQLGGLTLKNADATAGTNGGAIQDNSLQALSITKDTFTNNKAANGGAIYDAFGPVTISHSEFSGNKAKGSGSGVEADGGAIYKSGSGRLDVADSSFEHNYAVGTDGTSPSPSPTPTPTPTPTVGGDAEGGAIFTVSNTSLTHVKFTRNQAIAGKGGSSTVAGVSGAGGGDASGGAFYTDSFTASPGVIGGATLLSVSDVTFAYNSSVGGAGGNGTGTGPGGDGGNGEGAAISFDSPTGEDDVIVGSRQEGEPLYAHATILNTTFLGNTGVGGAGGNGGVNGNGGGGGPGRAGAIYNEGVMSVTNATFSDNTVKGGAGGNGPGIDTGGEGGEASGGAIWTEGPMSFTNPTFTTNQALGGTGGTGVSGGAGGSAHAGALFAAGPAGSECNCRQREF